MQEFYLVIKFLTDPTVLAAATPWLNFAEAVLFVFFCLRIALALIERSSRISDRRRKHRKPHP